MIPDVSLSSLMNENFIHNTRKSNRINFTGIQDYKLCRKCNSEPNKRSTNSTPLHNLLLLIYIPHLRKCTCTSLVYEQTSRILRHIQLSFVDNTREVHEMDEDYLVQCKTIHKLKVIMTHLHCESNNYRTLSSF